MENLLQQEAYQAANQELGGLHQVEALAEVFNLFVKIDSDAPDCEFSLINRFVKKGFGGLEYVGFIISFSGLYYEVLLS